MLMVVWTIALDVVQDVRGSIAMYLFILEEAIQTVGMSVYLMHKANMDEEVRSQAKWILDEIINPAIEFNNTYGMLAYPLNQAYSTFYESAKRNMETYLKVTKKFKLKVTSTGLESVEFLYNNAQRKTPIEIECLPNAEVTLKFTERFYEPYYELEAVEIDGEYYTKLEYTLKMTKDIDVIAHYEEYVP